MRISDWSSDACSSDLVVDHQVCGLKVQAFTSCVSGEQDLALRVLGELLGDLTSFTTAHPAVDRTNRVRFPDQRGDPVVEIVQGVAVLGEDDALPRIAMRVGEDRKSVV